MKVKIEFTVDIDADTWAREYSLDKSEVREDVKAYVENGARDHLSDMGLLSAPPVFVQEAYRA